MFYKNHPVYSISIKLDNQIKNRRQTRKSMKTDEIAKREFLLRKYTSLFTQIFSHSQVLSILLILFRFVKKVEDISVRKYFLLCFFIKMESFPISNIIVRIHACNLPIEHELIQLLIIFFLILYP